MSLLCRIGLHRWGPWQQVDTPASWTTLHRRRCWRCRSTRLRGSIAWLGLH